MMQSIDSNEVVLYQLFRCRYAPCVSPPCLKVETFLRCNKIPHRVVDATTMSPPDGRWPWITHSGKTICDSRRILEYLTKEFNLSCDANLDDHQRATALMLRRLCEDHLYFIGVRHAIVDNTATAIKYNCSPMPDLFIGLLYDYMRPMEITKLNHTNIGDLTEEEYLHDYVDDLSAIAAVLNHSRKTSKNSKCFILGTAEPTSADCVVYGHLSGMKFGDIAGELRGDAWKYYKGSVLEDYVRHVEAAVFPDIDSLLEAPRAMPFHRPILRMRHLKLFGVVSFGAVAAAIAQLYNW